MKASSQIIHKSGQQSHPVSNFAYEIQNTKTKAVFETIFYAPIFYEYLGAPWLLNDQPD